MNNFEAIKDIVREELRLNLQARDDDKILYFRVCEAMGFKIEISEGKVKLEADIHALPLFEAVRRARQLIQSPQGENLYPPSKEIDERRNKSRKEFKDKFGNKESSPYTHPNSWMSPDL